MKKVKILKPVVSGGKDGVYKVGDVVEMSENRYNKLKKLGKVEAFKNETVKKSTKEEKGAYKTKSKDDYKGKSKDDAPKSDDQ